MSNTRKLKPPPSGYSADRFVRALMESGLPEEEKRMILARLLTARPDRKGRVRGM